jgi:hypothetical protein
MTSLRRLFAVVREVQHPPATTSSMSSVIYANMMKCDSVVQCRGISHTSSFSTNGSLVQGTLV